MHFFKKIEHSQIIRQHEKPNNMFQSQLQSKRQLKCNYCKATNDDNLIIYQFTKRATKVLPKVQHNKTTCTASSRHLNLVLIIYCNTPVSPILGRGQGKRN